MFCALFAVLRYKLFLNYAQKSTKKVNSIVSSPENVCTDSDQGGALADRQRPVAAHAHAQFRCAGNNLSQASSGLGNGSKVSRYALNGVGVRGHAHDTLDFNSGEGLTLARALYKVVRQESGLCLLGGNVDLEQHARALAKALGLGADKAQQPLGVDALNDVDMWHQAAQFVGLHMANEVPDAVVGHQRRLLRQFINAALAKQSLTGFISLSDCLNGVELADCHQSDSLGERPAQPQYVIPYLRHRV